MFRTRRLLFAIGAALTFAGCAQPPYAPVTPSAARAGESGTTRDRAMEDRILALDPEHVSEQDVRNTLAAGPTPRVILLHGGVLGTDLLMTSFGKFLTGMGYPEKKIRDPSDEEWSQQPYGSTKRLAGEIAWYYEQDGLRPMLVGHSQGGIQAVKVLYELDGAFDDKIEVWNAVADAPEPRTSITDPLTGKERSVIGVSASLVATVGAGGVALLAPPHWDMVQRLHTIPDTVVEFTGYAIYFDLIGWTFPGTTGWVFEHNGTAEVRNVLLPSTYNHVFVPVTHSLSQDPAMRNWINAYVPGRDNGEAPGAAEGRAGNELFAADVWFTIKKHWVLEAQRLIKARRSASPVR
jgi:hypothetical protein